MQRRIRPAEMLGGYAIVTPCLAWDCGVSTLRMDLPSPVLADTLSRWERGKPSQQEAKTIRVRELQTLAEQWI